MWITNGGFADVYIVFAKVDGEKFTAFIVERTFPGFKPGNEEHKMGIHGSSTTPIFLENCKVPKENLLHEIGRGHIVAFNILNAGRFTLGASCVGGAKHVLIATASKYAQRTQSLRQTHRRLRPDEGKARGNGHTDFRRGIHGVPRAGKHRNRHARRLRLRRQRLRTP